MISDEERASDRCVLEGTHISCALEKRREGNGDWHMGSQLGEASNEGAIHPSVKQEARCRDCQVGDLRE